MTVMEQNRPAGSPPLIDGWLAAWNVETAIYLLVGVVAFVLRFAFLGDPPLSALEAREALSAWRFVSMSEIAPVQPVSAALHSLTSLAFFLFGANEFWARFWPMTAGWTLIFLPALFRREVGRWAALAASAMLAISPVMLATSRTADGTTLAAASLMMAMAGLRRFQAHDDRRGLILAGVALGFGLATGPRFISAALASLLALVLAGFAWPEAARTLRAGWQRAQPHVGTLLVAAGVTFVLAASAAGFNPAGLSAAGAALPLWLNGWVLRPETRPAWLVPQLLLVHESLLLFMGVGGLYVAFVSDYWNRFVTRGRRLLRARQPDMELAPAVGGGGFEPVSWQASARVLGAAAVGALLFGIVYPGREAGDTVWVVLPLAMLAGKVVVEVFSGDWFEGEAETVAAQAVVLFVMLVFVYFQLAGFGRGYVLFPDRPLEIRLALAGGVIALGIFVTVMFALGWSRLSAMRGAVLALGAVAVIGTLGAGLGMTYWRAGDPNDLWTAVTTSANIKMMGDSLRAISDRAAGNESDVEIVVVNTPAAADRDGLLGWELRNFSKVRYVDSPGAASNSPVVIADESVSDPALGSAYVGESFPVQLRQLQAEPTLQGLTSWWLYRAWPTQYSRRVNLWVRADIHQLLEQR
jgi:hypothetical protein